MLATVEKGDITELAKTTWRAPEVFTAKARDGKTDIWGIIVRPSNFDRVKDLSGDRKHLRRTAGLVRAEIISHVLVDDGPG